MKPATVSAIHFSVSEPIAFFAYLDDMKKHEPLQSKDIWVENDFLEKYDLEDIPVIQLLFLTGYLTVRNVK